jgi:hypothetical protein
MEESDAADTSEVSHNSELRPACSRGILADRRRRSRRAPDGYLTPAPVPGAPLPLPDPGAPARVPAKSRHYMLREDYAQQHGAAAADFDAVKAFTTLHGLTVAESERWRSCSANSLLPSHRHTRSRLLFRGSAFSWRYASPRHVYRNNRKAGKLRTLPSSRVMRHASRFAGVTAQTKLAGRKLGSVILVPIGRDLRLRDQEACIIIKLLTIFVNDSSCRTKPRGGLMPGPDTTRGSHHTSTARPCARRRRTAVPIRPTALSAANPPRAGPDEPFLVHQPPADTAMGDSRIFLMEVLQ